jgi:hypothetical protein
MDLIIDRILKIFHCSDIEKIRNRFNDYLNFIILLLLLFIWQILLIFRSSYSKDALELFVGISIICNLKNVFINSIYFNIVIFLTFAMFIMLSVFGFTHQQWIVLLIIFSSIKMESIGKQKEIIDIDKKDISDLRD